MNQFRLDATISSVSTLRYTPAGLPALDLELSHESEVEHSGHKRQVVMVVKALAIGALAETLQGETLGSAWQFVGFMASSRAKPQPSRQLVFHLHSAQPAPSASGPTPLIG